MTINMDSKKPRIVSGCIFVVAMGWMTCTGLLGVQVEPLLDFTTYRPQVLPDPLGATMVLASVDQYLLRSHDSQAGVNRPKPPIPPLSLTVLGSAISGSRQLPVLTISLRIRNNGSVPYLFPLSIDSGRVSVLQGQKGRRLNVFTVKMTNSDGNKEVSMGPLQTEGSETFPNSLFELKPGAAMVVKFNSAAGDTINWPVTAGSINVRLSVGLAESLLDDSGYIFKATSGEVWTENKFNLQIPR